MMNQQGRALFRYLFLLVIVLLVVNCGGQSAESDPAQATEPQSGVPSNPTVDPNAPNFYVATDGNDDSGNGSADSPWATITHALDSVPDGSVILVREGVYTGRVRIRGQFANGVTVRSEVPYRAQLRADETVLTIFEAQGITIEGFDISHLNPSASDLVIQIQDAMGDEPGGAEFTSRITLRNNIIHDSYSNDLLKINNGAQQIAVLGNLFYNQGDSDEHIDINSVADVVVADNIFFNAFEGSNRPITGESSSFIVVKDSNDSEDGIVGTRNLTIQRNIFLHYEGSEGHNMVLLGEDGASYFEADNVLIENNLFLGDGRHIRAPFGTKGVHNVVFRHNTISGDMPGGAFAWRSNVEGDNQANDNIQLYNNIFSDPTGTMDNFATAPQGETDSFTLNNNLYWNGGQPLPTGGDESISIQDDGQMIEGDPRLNPAQNIALPLWDSASATFGDGSADIRTVFLSLVQTYGVPQADSAAIDRADAEHGSAEDILGQPRTIADLGAYEVQGNEQAVVLPTVEPGIAPTPAPAESNNIGSAETVTSLPTLALPTAGGWVTFALQNGDDEHLYRLPLTANAVPEDVTALLDRAATGQYSEWLNVSPDGEWFLLSTDRFDRECNGWPCLAVTQDFVTFESVKSGGAAVHAAGFSAIANGGNLIVYYAGDGTHARDLFAIRRDGNAWSAPVELTTASPFQEHMSPRLSADSTQVVFICGDDSYYGEALCEANTDGSDFNVRFRANEGGANGSLYYPAYEPTGSILFEADWNAEQLWRLQPGSNTPTLVSTFANDNSPCVLPDGSIVSLWLQREANTSGVHEIKLMSADGTQYTMALTGVDVFDIGIGCGQ